MRPTPLEPTLTAHLFPRLGEELLTLLRSLDRVDWERPTVCAGWAVRDVAAHLLDTACRRLSLERDGYELVPASDSIDSFDSLVSYLDELNAAWTRASMRLSPGVLIDLLAAVEPPLAEVLAGLDPHAPSRHPVAWAGETSSPYWFDIARELTERWLHQQQIRLAVGAQPLTDPELSEPVFDTFLRALPRRYARLNPQPQPGTQVGLSIQGRQSYDYTLRFEDEWQLLKGLDGSPQVSIEIAEASAWLRLTKGLSADAARAAATVSGEEDLAAPFFKAIAVMG